MKTYRQIAENDFEGARGLADIELWNLAGQHIQQACEKQLKGWLEEHNRLDITLARTHNLRKLLREIGDYDEDFYKVAALVENFYFDTKYPGDDYMDLSKRDIDAAVAFYAELLYFLNNKGVK